MRTLRIVLLTASAGLALTMLPTAAGAAPVDPPPALSELSISQIDALAAAKAARTPAQRKIDSPLLVAAGLARGRTSGLAAAPKMKSSVPVDGTGRTPLEIHGKIDAPLLKQVENLGGHVDSSHPEAGSAHVALPLTAVETLAASANVTRINSVAAGFVTSRAAPARSTLHDTQGLPLRQRLRDVVAPEKAFSAMLSATVTSEGDTAHGAAAARARFGVSGVGITVGVLSDGVDSLQASIAGGELPADVGVLPGAAGSGDEGTALLEIVHDVAPKTKLLFATAIAGADDFAANIRALRAAGADIIVDDVLYFAESPFQDGPIAQAVIDVTRDGALYFSSAGNEGNKDDGTSGNYEGDFVNSGLAIGKFGGVAHDFAPGPAKQVVDPTTPGSVGAPVLLQWADPLGGSRNDYDLYVLDSAGNVVAVSNDIQDGDDDPFEGLFLPESTDPLRIAVVKFSGAGRYFQLTVLRGRFTTDGLLRGQSTAGVTRGHSAVPAAFSVAAAPAASPLPFELEPGDSANPSGPFPNQFTGSQQAERFGSDGPRRVFFTPNGRPLTPGNFTATGGRVRQKPDLTAADGVRTSVGEFDPFFGTSAAAPHAAAMAALVLSGRPGASASLVRRAIMGSGLDIQAPGWDRDTGRGILQPGNALTTARAHAQSYAVAGEAHVVSSTDGDTFAEPGETAVVEIPVTNLGDAGADRVHLRLRSNTVGLRITPATRAYGPIAAGATVTRRYRVAIAASVPLGSTPSLQATVSFSGAFSPQATDTDVVIGQPADQTVGFAYAGPAVAIPDADPTGVSLPVTVSGLGAVSSASFSIDGSACATTDGSAGVGLDHSFVGDLVGTLTAPDGTTVKLFDRFGGEGDNICQMRLIDTAARSIETATAEEAPFVGEWLPAEPLAALRGTQGDGIWHFTVADQAAADEGSIRAFTLSLAGYVQSQS